jgi:hypothetical protein
MRLGVIGPSRGQLNRLREAAEFLVNKVHVDRAVYLGVDDALDEVVASMAAVVVGGDPSVESIWDRAVSQCLKANPEEIQLFLEKEQARERLKVLECLPNANSRAVEMLDGRMSVLLHDKALLDEEDILPAILIIFGKNRAPLIRRVGPRTFVSPGGLDNPDGGLAVCDEYEGSIEVKVYNQAFQIVAQETISTARSGKMRVTGEK